MHASILQDIQRAHTTTKPKKIPTFGNTSNYATTVPTRSYCITANLPEGKEIGSFLPYLVACLLQYLLLPLHSTIMFPCLFSTVLQSTHTLISHLQPHFSAFHFPITSPISRFTLHVIISTIKSSISFVIAGIGPAYF